jgi:hypothetical protein
MHKILPAPMNLEEVLKLADEIIFTKRVSILTIYKKRYCGALYNVRHISK